MMNNITCVLQMDDGSFKKGVASVNEYATCKEIIRSVIDEFEEIKKDHTEFIVSIVGINPYETIGRINLSDNCTVMICHKPKNLMVKWKESDDED